MSILGPNCQNGLGRCEQDVTDIVCDFLKWIGSMRDIKKPE